MSINPTPNHNNIAPSRRGQNIQSEIGFLLQLQVSVLPGYLILNKFDFKPVIFYTECN